MKDSFVHRAQKGQAVIVNLIERRRRIIEILEQEKQVSTQQLEEMMAVSGVTIRADLRELEQEGVIERYHGGAMLLEQKRPDQSYVSFTRRSLLQAAEKDAIGREAARLVRSGQSIILDASSTVLAMIPYLTGIHELTVITNGIHTAMAIQKQQEVHTIMIGGVLRPHSGSVEGLLGEDLVRHLGADAIFVSANGLTFERGLSGFNVHELDLKKRMMRQAHRLIALIDHSKLGVDSSASYADFSAIDTLVTDDRADESFVAQARRLGCKVIIARRRQGD
jgi:DeoR/GlpR family transcriptional regulator of sugar metabolism